MRQPLSTPDAHGALALASPFLPQSQAEGVRVGGTPHLLPLAVFGHLYIPFAHQIVYESLLCALYSFGCQGVAHSLVEEAEK